jgi:hypothetical protein
LGLTLKPF